MIHEQKLFLFLNSIGYRFKNSFFFLVLLICFGGKSFAQTDTSATKLNEILVKAFEQNRKLLDVPAAVSVISQKQLLRFSNTSIVAVVNTQPGIRMEERSPGSYRLNIRGSTLRSPFGVRNVKVYLNDIPFTEPGGATYLNQLSFFNIQAIEVLKGPSGSLYGAGSGGVALLKTHLQNQAAGVGIDYSFGSFGLQNTNVYARIGEGNTQQTIGFSKLHSDGYRDWTTLNRAVFYWDSKIALNPKQNIQSYVMYADLRYQTPGGLTLAEFTLNPRQARPSIGILPSSESANAGVNQETFFAGISHEYKIRPDFINKTSLYGAFSKFANPTIRNFERRFEPHIGGRSVFTFSPIRNKGALKFITGIEFQKGWYNIQVYKNINGLSDVLQTEDDVTPFIWNVFSQIDWHLPHNWIVNFGASLNQNRIEITRLNKLPLRTQKRNYQNEIVPRIAILKKITPNISIYTSLAKGFSPPTTAEVLPSTGIITTALNAEEGWNQEIGSRIKLFKEKIFIDFNGFIYNLNNAIVQRRDSNGADYFINAGSTNQKGIEGAIHYKIIDNKDQFISLCNLWTSYTYNNFKYKEFKQLNTDFSNNRLPGIPLSTVATGIDLGTKQGTYLNLTYTYNGVVPLNDANTYYGTDYHLLTLRLGHKTTFFKKWNGELFIGGDNLFNETYSLGYDINAAANRFYNVAQGRNYFAGISLFLGNTKN